MIGNYNAFPTRKLAEMARNVSKLERLMLLWQYNNGCLFEPAPNDTKSNRFVVGYDFEENDFLIDAYTSWRYRLVYFETEEQCKAFIEMYQDEIKRLWGIGDEQ